MATILKSSFEIRVFERFTTKEVREAHMGHGSLELDRTFILYQAKIDPN